MTSSFASDRFTSLLHLSANKSIETAANKKLSQNLLTCLNGLDFVPVNSRTLIYTLASTCKETAFLLPINSAILDGRLQSNDQVLTFNTKIQAALKHCSDNNGINLDSFDSDCGVNVTISLSDIQAEVNSTFSELNDEITKKRYAILGLLLQTLRKKLRFFVFHPRWADNKVVKDEVERKLELVLGPKDDRDDPKKSKKSKAPPAKSDSQIFEPAIESIKSMSLDTKFIFEGELSKMHAAGQNPQLYAKIMEEHLTRTGSKVITRFPPEPNGFLHIGHAKAMNINFGYAQAHNGLTNLRYDDTNPEAEEQIYFDSIKDSLDWLGFTPSKITYASDLFEHLYKLAIELIKRDKAYICHSTGEQIHEQRGGDSKGKRFDSPWRNRPIAESLKEFERMKNGEYKEGEAILRMKMDMNVFLVLNYIAS
jgi:glutaminyl-tRNA synthetase